MTSRPQVIIEIGLHRQDVMFYFLTSNQNKLFVSCRLFSQTTALGRECCMAALLTNQFSPSPPPVLGSHVIH